MPGHFDGLRTQLRSGLKFNSVALTVFHWLLIFSVVATILGIWMWSLPVTITLGIVSAYLAVSVICMQIHQAQVAIILGQTVIADEMSLFQTNFSQTKSPTDDY